MFKQRKQEIRSLMFVIDAGPAWDPNANDDVLTFAVAGSQVCASGSFTAVSGKARGYFAPLAP